MPFGVIAGAGSTSTCSCTSAYVDPDRRIPSGGAFCSIADEIRIVSPVRTCCPASASPTTTSPVLTPVRTTSRTPQRPFELVVEVGKDGQALGRSLDRADRVVHARASDPEDRHDGVTDDLLDRPAVRLVDESHLVEVPGEDLTQRLGVEPLTEGGRTLQVGLHDGGEPPGLGRYVIEGERRGAIDAEARILDVLRPACLADHHRLSLRPRDIAARRYRTAHGTAPAGARGGADRGPLRDGRGDPRLAVVRVARWREERPDPVAVPGRPLQDARSDRSRRRGVPVVVVIVVSTRAVRQQSGEPGPAEVRRRSVAPRIRLRPVPRSDP